MALLFQLDLMEREYMKVARGEVRRDDMLRTTLQQMKQCFIDCVQHAEKLLQAIGHHFANTSRNANGNRNGNGNATPNRGMDMDVGNPHNGNHPNNRIGLN